ncbi:hypothetical protein QMK19_22005 [Streptomyces sp. H10-C2]|uniref:hypothetical protein n=1 Tax=unclassified Streptomyces TaxID=2593676 RepID=UPI0024BABC47|nr:MULTISPECIES: hypothetical protein [unclassified Streptomyces]MDJ0342409.1 hypothetical protein [Streptomyces sp. PH10-H1]MDJ0372264.1 hypothetical protein [Streptomyces sp. H10-C2]
MTTETPKPLNDGGIVKPDNWHNDSTTEALPDVLRTEAAPDPTPDNWHNDSEPLK